jgi:hypothetical protein
MYTRQIVSNKVDERFGSATSGSGRDVTNRTSSADAGWLGDAEWHDQRRVRGVALLVARRCG